MNKRCNNCNRETLNNSKLCIYCKIIKEKTLKETINECIKIIKQYYSYNESCINKIKELESEER